MSIKARLALLLGMLLVVFLAALQTLRWLERARAEEMLADSIQANQVAVQRWIDLLVQPVQRLAHDYSHWPEMAGFIARPNPAWAETNLRQTLSSYDAQALWVADASGRTLYSARVNDGPVPPLPLAESDLASISPSDSGRRFFAESRDGLMEVWLNPVAAAGANPHGWLLVAKLWNPRHVAALSRLVEAQIHLAPLLNAPGPEYSRTQLQLPMKDFYGTVLRQLVVRFPPPDFTDSFARDTLAANLFVAFGLLVVIALWLGVRQWVLNPLDQIGESLTREDPKFIHPLRGENNELGRVARLVESSFAQKADLQREIAEHSRAESALRESELQVRRSLELRARLSRDLHDGVIQSIYAAGLGLETALSQMDQVPAGVRAPLQQCRQSLNDIIREIRGFIMGLEPEQMPQQGFAQELESLARTMQTLWHVHITLQIDSTLARCLNPSQEVHALQIVRECISNALRHGEADEVRISLASKSGRGVLTIRDNGRGFEPAMQPADKGHGLLNIASRAQEMGGASIVQSEPAHGTTVILHFPLATAPA